LKYCSTSLGVDIGNVSRPSAKMKNLHQMKMVKAEGVSKGKTFKLG